ncbi:hypothetical protein ACLIMP_14875 [Novosphingobium aerophilum]|uniref:hypothetical protein n=1 Tax=Novosphingobium TaxID=165696 RepID=UPI002D799AEB|nr:hypothetical protein [Novosphingobium sp. RL4]WRT92531.1 hypothetical protein U9J33_15195 [Novosphingobium sp. RL4]
MSDGAPWSILGIEKTSDSAAIRKAYAARLKAMDVDRDVTGFAQLRQARDLALRLARNIDLPPVEEEAETAAEPEFGPSPEAPPRWTYAAPELPGEWQTGTDLAARPGEPDDSTMLGRMAWAAAAAREGVSGAGIPLTTIDPFTAPFLPGNHAADDALGLRPGESPAERLAILLDPESETAAEPLTETEARQATRALRKILDDAAQSHVTRQQQIEDWLAEVLARGWPRSAPLLEDANAAFGWEREWAAHDARAGVAFLGARLRGYRFQQNVLQPGHRYNKAWNELVRPGKASPFRMLSGPSQGDVDALLRGVRKNFPELESHFAPERVASWEGGNPFMTGLLVALGLIAFAIVLAVAQTSNSPSSRPDRVAAASPLEAQGEEAETVPGDGAVTRIVQASIREAFGEDRDMNWLQTFQPELAQVFTANARNGVKTGEEEPVLIDKAVAIVRERSYRNGRDLSGDLFEKAMRLRLGQLRAAREQGASACRQLGNSGWLDSLEVSPELRSKERDYAVQLVESHALGAPKASDQHSAMVPGTLIEDVMKATKLSQSEVAEAMQGKSSDANRCAVTIALLDKTLGWRGKNRRDILMTL